MRLQVLGILMVLQGSLAKVRWTVRSTTPAVEPRNQSDSSTCYTENQQEGVCVKYSMCNLEAPKVDPSSSNFVYRIRKPPAQQQCDLFKMCCPHGQVRTKPVVPAVPAAQGCGYSYPGGVFREKTDTSKSGYADFGEFPWMVALLKKRGGEEWVESDYIGGGTLITPSVVMTVAHKVDGFMRHELKCRAGEWNTQNENEILSYQERDVKQIIIHSEFAGLHAQNDMALLVVETEFEIDAHVNIACLGRRLPPPGAVCYSMGWGQDFLNSEYNANVLKKITLPLVSPGDCESMLRKTRLGRGYTLHESLTCAGGEKDVDTCMGDGGSSLVCHIGAPESLRYVVMGMVSYGLECGTENEPGVYVNVPHLYNWVANQIDALEGGT